MKRMIFFIALFAALAVIIYSDRVFAMGSKGGAVQQQKEKKQEDTKTEGQVEKEVKKDGGDFSTPGKGKEKKEKSSPKKKPRLKYRDDSKCPC